jgi:hypothetical protein
MKAAIRWKVAAIHPSSGHRLRLNRLGLAHSSTVFIGLHFPNLTGASINSIAVVEDARMVGGIGSVSSVLPVRQSRVAAAAAHANGTVGSTNARDRLDISSLGLAQFASFSPKGDGPRSASSSAGDSALNEMSGLLSAVKALIGEGDADHSPDDARSRQLHIDALLASVDRVAGAAPGASAPASKSALRTGQDLTLADLRTGGALTGGGDRAGATRVVDAVIAQVAGAQNDAASPSAAAIDDSASDSAGATMDDLKGIREMMLAAGPGGVGEGNRGAIVQMLK